MNHLMTPLPVSIHVDILTHTGEETAPEEHGLHTLVQGTVNHCPNRLTGLITQFEKKGWNVQKIK